MDAPPENEKAPGPLAGSNAIHQSHERDDDATGAQFRDRLADALQPLATEKFQAEIEQSLTEARVDELLRKRIEEREGAR